MDQADADLLERIAAGERVFRPGDDVSGRLFEVLVNHLRELHRRGLIDMPDRSVASRGNPVGTYLMAGPCFLTDAGREALENFRRPERREGDRRMLKRRQQAARWPEEDRRQGERRQGERRGDSAPTNREPD